MPDLFPVLIGRSWPVVRRPNWSSLIQTAVNQKQTAIAKLSFPTYTYSFVHNVLKAGLLTSQDFQILLGFYNKMLGRVYPFLYDDPNDNSVTDQVFGTGDGITLAFQLNRTLGGFNEPVQSVAGITNVKIDGSTTTDFSFDNTGVLTFGSAPAADTVLTWTGTYSWLCRFDQDQYDFSEFAKALYELQQLSFTTVPL